MLLGQYFHMRVLKFLSFLYVFLLYIVQLRYEIHYTAYYTTFGKYIHKHIHTSMYM